MRCQSQHIFRSKLLFPLNFRKTLILMLPNRCSTTKKLTSQLSFERIGRISIGVLRLLEHHEAITSIKKSLIRQGWSSRNLQDLDWRRMILLVLQSRILNVQSWLELDLSWPVFSELKGFSPLELREQIWVISRIYREVLGRQSTEDLGVRLGLDLTINDRLVVSRM